MKVQSLCEALIITCFFFKYCQALAHQSKIWKKKKKKNYGYSLIFPVNFSYIHTEYKINLFSEKKNQNLHFFSNRIEESKMFKS